MSPEIEFFFDFISPYTYLAHVRLQRLAAARQVGIRHRPIAPFDLMAKVGNRPTTLESANKRAYAMIDLERWAARDGITFAANPNWQTLDFGLLGRGALVAIEDGRGGDYLDAVYPAVYGQPRDLGEPGELRAVLDAAGFDGAQLLERAGSASKADELAANTTEAAERGVFGSPTMFVRGQMFFGNDRLDFVVGALDVG